ncbi:aspartate-semialdehyde dehydrogenase [Patescibacteria group bacterium]|nr:aspartate-semialdehyde dehydrogenase [Patescibacteria group bacterium]
MKNKKLKKKLRVGILGATGMVGQRFISLLEKHPWFDVVVLAASSQSAGKKYEEAVRGRWCMKNSIPKKIKKITVKAVEGDFNEIVKNVDLVFSAIDMSKKKIKEVEEHYASAGIAVVSNNSAHRWTEDVPMIMPEINENHLSLVSIQRKKRGWKKGLLVVKPNCSLQSYLPVIYALKQFNPQIVSVTTLQAISGAGKTFESWPEMVDNCIPFIGGEEEKTEKEPLKILGIIKNKKIELAKNINISATCIRVSVSDGHMASVSVKFKKKPTFLQIKKAIINFKNSLAKLNLPSAPKKFIKYFSENNRPQTKLDRDYENGMGITCGRFREDKDSGWKFIALSHNTIRGAAGGAILVAELLYKKGYLSRNF